MRDILFSVFAIIGLCLGFSGTRKLGHALGYVLWIVLPKRRKLAIEAIAFHLECPKDQARRLARESFKHNCRSFLEIFLRSRVDLRYMSEHVTVQTPESYQAFLNDPRPKVLVSGHIGAWEAGMSVSRVLYPHLEGGAIMRSVKNPAVNNLVIRLRSRPRRTVIENRQGSLKALRILRRNGVVVFIVDHNCTRESAIFLPFLNKTAAVHKGPAVLALRSKAMVWPLFCMRRPGERLDFFFDEPLDTATLKGTEEEKIEAIARFYTQAVERHIRQDPEQWFWLHKRWKTRPEGEN